MADRYWVGGTASWDATAGTKWALTSGGAGGQAVPTSADNVFFDAASGAVTVTISAPATCLDLTCTGFTGTIAGAFALDIHGNCTRVAGMGWTHSGAVSFPASSGSFNITNGGKTFNGTLTLGLNAAGTATRTLQDAMAVTGEITHYNGTFTTNNFAVTAASLTSIVQTRTINFGSSTVTLGAITFGATSLTFNAGTSTVIMNGSGNFDMGTAGGARTFYDVSFTDTTSDVTIRGNNTFRNLTIAGRVASGIRSVTFSGFFNDDQTITGTLALSAGTNASCRTVLAASRNTTLTCAAVSATDADFKNITIAGAAAPASGTRLGNRLGNSGITFPAAKTVYWNLAAGGNWGGAIGWATSSGGSPAINNFPLPQDTAIIENTGLNSGATITFNASYAFTTLNMSARTSSMTFATSSFNVLVLGNWTNGTGVTLSGTGTLQFSGRISQSLTSAGATFTQTLSVNENTSLSLQDAFTTSNASGGSTVALTSGSLTCNNFSITLTGVNSGFSMSTGTSFNLGSGTLTVAGDGGVTIAGFLTNVTGTGTISLTSASAKTFAGGGLQTYPTLNQGGTGTLTITGANKFAGLTNTAIGRIQFSANNEFDVFSINGISGNLLQLGSDTTTRRTLTKPSAWNVGANSTDAGNNLGLSFTAGGNDYLSISYIEGVSTAPVAGGNFFLLF